jgi:hypothetical protein
MVVLFSSCLTSLAKGLQRAIHILSGVIIYGLCPLESMAYNHLNLLIFYARGFSATLRACCQLRCAANKVEVFREPARSVPLGT